MLADGDAEIAVEGLKDDVDGLAARRAGVWFGDRAGEVRHEERPAHEAEELDDRREYADRRGDGQERAVGVRDRAREQHDQRGQEHGGERECPPQPDQRGAGGAEGGEDFPVDRRRMSG
jgi:hypothetical protein